MLKNRLIGVCEDVCDDLMERKLGVQRSFIQDSVMQADRYLPLQYTASSCQISEEVNVSVGQCVH